MYICLINKFDTMKRLLSLLAPVAAALVILTVSCKKDKAPANSAEMDAYLSEAPYLNHLPDDAQILISFHPLQLLEKSRFAVDEAFAPLRDQILGDMDPATKIAALASLKDPSLAGLDPAHPLVIAVTSLKMAKNDISAEIYGVLPLTNRELFVTLLNKADAGLTPDKDGNYRIKEQEYALAIEPEGVFFYGLLGREANPSAIAKKLDEMVAKNSLYVGSPLAESVLMDGDDLALHLSKNTADLLMNFVSQQTGTDMVKLLGGNPMENLNTLLRFNCRRGKLLAESRVEGTNPLYERYASWLGTPDKGDMKMMPSYLAAGGQLALQNVPDMLDYIQGVLDRSGEADGVVLADVLRAVGISRDDLNEVGTISFGYINNNDRDDDFIVIARAGEKIVSALDGMIGQLGMDRHPKNGYMRVSGDYYAGFQGDYACLVTGGMISRSTAPNHSYYADILHGNSLFADLALSFHVPQMNHALLSMDTRTATLELVTADQEVNAAKTLLKVLIEYLEANVFTTEEDEGFDEFFSDDDFDPDFDYLY